jgi:SAM-dependent methyltransferase
MFLEKHGHLHLHGRVVDYGCGKQPYRDLIESFEAQYVPYDDPEFPASCAEERYSEADWSWDSFDAAVCTQVIQYVPSPSQLIIDLAILLTPRKGTLLITYPTNWDEVEGEDLQRFTAAGIERLLKREGFIILEHERRAEVDCGGFRFPLGGGVVARA